MTSRSSISHVSSVFPTPGSHANSTLWGIIKPFVLRLWLHLLLRRFLHCALHCRCCDVNSVLVVNVVNMVSRVAKMTVVAIRCNASVDHTRYPKSIPSIYFPHDEHMMICKPFHRGPTTKSKPHERILAPRKHKRQHVPYRLHHRVVEHPFVKRRVVLLDALQVVCVALGK